MASWQDPMFKWGEMVTGPSARRLIERAGLLEPSDSPLVVFDNACGSGVVTSLLHETLEDGAKRRLEITCGDVSQRAVDAVQQRITDNGWQRTTAKIVDAQITGLPDSYFTHVVTSMGVMLMSDSNAAVNEISRILRSGGICAFSTWKTTGYMADIRAAVATIPGAPPFPEHDDFMKTMNRGALWHHPSYVEQQLAAHGFEDVKVEVMTSLPSIDSPAAYAELFSRVIVGFMAPLIWSNEDREKYADLVKPALLEYTTEKYGEGQRIEWEVTAIVATGRKP